MTLEQLSAQVFPWLLNVGLADLGHFAQEGRIALPVHEFRQDQFAVAVAKTKKSVQKCLDLDWLLWPCMHPDKKTAVWAHYTQDDLQSL